MLEGNNWKVSGQPVCFQARRRLHAAPCATSFAGFRPSGYVPTGPYTPIRVILPSSFTVPYWIYGITPRPTMFN